MFYCFLLIVGAENANNFWCCEKVTNVYIDNNKNVNLKGSWRNDYMRICSTDEVMELIQ